MLAVTATLGTDGDQLITEALRKRRPGLHGVWVKDADWGSADWDSAILRYMADDRVGNSVVAAIRDLESEGWSSIELYWVADASNFLKERVSLEQLTEKLLGLDYLPHLTEIILRRPPVANLKPSLLDELHSTLSIEGIGSIYCPPGDLEFRRRALVQISKCATSWIVRMDQLTTKERTDGV